LNEMPGTDPSAMLQPVPGLGELRRDTLYQQAYDALKLALMCGQLRPGRAVPLRSLATQLGVSPMPVRDALNRLVTQGALELLANRSVRVPFMTRTKFKELTTVRCDFESKLAELGAKLINAGGIAQMRAVNDEMKLAAQKNDPNAFLNANYQFHFTLYRAAGSQIMLPITESLWLQAGPFLNECIQSVGFLTASKHHDAIIAALGKRNAALVAKEITADIRDAAKAADQSLA